METVDFVCTNGDFQNYNVLRRFLAGQTHYQDFSNYLGAAMFLMVAPIAAFHNTFAFSLFATNTVICVLFILFVAVVFYLFTRNRYLSAAAGLAMPVLVSSRIFEGVIPHFGYYVNFYLSMLAQPKNSMRMLRLFLPVLLIIFLLLYLKRTGEPSLADKLLERRFLVLCAFIVGLFLTWSNDFGVATIVSASFLFLLLTVVSAAQRRIGAGPAVKNVLCWVGALCVGMFLSVMLASGFHPMEWLRDTTQIAQWQYWYFGTTADAKMNSFVHFIQGYGLRGETKHYILYHTVFVAAVAIFCFVRLVQRRLTNNQLLYGFLLCTIFMAASLYMYGGGNFYFEEGLYDIFILTVMAGAAWAVQKGIVFLLSRRKTGLGETVVRVVSLAVIAAVLGLSVLKDARQFKAVASVDPARQDYIAELGGATTLAPSLNRMAEIVGDEPLFSTYASGLDLMQETFQPTGSDYIIHALGNENYDAYVRELESGRYHYVQTVNPNTWIWENWVNRVSWQFYKVLYANYHVKEECGYWTIWERNAGPANTMRADTAVTVEMLDGQTAKLTVKSSCREPGYAADITVAYSASRIRNLYGMQTWRTSLFVKDECMAALNDKGFEGYFQPVGENTRQLRVDLTDGEGSLILTTQPAECTALTIHSAAASDILYATGFETDSIDIRPVAQ